MCQSKIDVQKAFEEHYFRQMQEIKQREREDILDAIEIAIYDALSECDCVANNLVVSEPNMDSIYESTLFAINSIKSAAKELEQLAKMLSSE